VPKECVLEALTELDHSGNAIGQGGARALSDVLPLPCLDETESSRIDTEGAQALSVALPQCTALSRLYLDANYTIGDEGAQSLSEVLPLCSASGLVLVGRKIEHRSATLHCLDLA